MLICHLPKEWNPRYVAYAQSQGRSPAAQIKYDQKQWPGGCMAGYILWISKMRRLFYKVSPRSFCGNHIADQSGFTQFVESEAGE